MENAQAKRTSAMETPRARSGPRGLIAFPAATFQSLSASNFPSGRKLGCKIRRKRFRQNLVSRTRRRIDRKRSNGLARRELPLLLSISFVANTESVIGDVVIGRRVVPMREHAKRSLATRFQSKREAGSIHRRHTPHQPPPQL